MFCSPSSCLTKEIGPTVIVSGVYPDIPAWPGREREDSSDQKSYFGIQTADRVIEFECKNKGEKQMWTDGIQNLLNCRISI